MSHVQRNLCYVILTASLVLVAPAVGQTKPDEHTGHHPQPGASVPAADATVATPSGAASGSAMPAGAGAMTSPMGTPPASVAAGPAAGGSAPGAAMGGGMSGMGGMMESMMGGAAGATPIYPTLMSLPAITPEKRAQLYELARQQVVDGMARLIQGSQSLDIATHAGDEVAKQQAVGTMHEALRKVDAGISVRRVLSEGKSPQGLAFDWFKREMDLAPSAARDEPHTHLGLSPLHLFTMALLIAFGIAMLVMSFFRLRRATALFRRLEPDAKSPPPGSSPPLGGAPGPTAPPAGKPPSGGPPTPTTLPAADSPATPAAVKAAPPAGADTPPPPVTTARPADGSFPSTSTANPVNPATAKWQGLLRVESIVNETPLVKTYRLRSPGQTRLPITYRPGQFLNVAFAVGGARMNRSYSISSSPNERDYVDLTIKREERGAVSRHIHNLLKVGDEIEAGGPVGTFTFSGTEAGSIVLIAAGVGITPMMSIARYLSENSWPGEIYFFYACRTTADFIFRESLAALERRNSRLHVVVTMSDAGPEWKGARGRLGKELLMQTVPNLASQRIHLCGPPAMMDATKALLLELGVAPENLKTEAFGAVKPSPAAPVAAAKPTAPATGPMVTFSANSKSSRIHTDQTILELSEELLIGIQNSCRIGTCGVCKVKMTSGEVEMAVDDALDAQDKANRIILACQAKPTSDVVVEA